MFHHLSNKCYSDGNKLRGYLIYWSVCLNLQYTFSLVYVSFAVRPVHMKNKSKREQNKRIFLLRIRQLDVELYFIFIWIFLKDEEYQYNYKVVQMLARLKGLSYIVKDLVLVKFKLTRFHNH